jgi:pilus assembly protein Flp/PilA
MELTLRTANMLSMRWSNAANRLFSRFGGAIHRQTGQGMVEYALILVLVSIVVIVILLTMGRQIKNVFSNVVAALG